MSSKLLINPDGSKVRIGKDNDLYKVGVKGVGYDYYRRKDDALKAYAYLQAQELSGLDMEDALEALKRL